MLSDDSTSDSDSGIRFKTDSTRREKAEADAANLDRRRDVRNNRDFDRNNRNRVGPSFGQTRDRERNDKSPQRHRDRSPYREKTWQKDDKFSRDNRNRIDHSRDRNREPERNNRLDRSARNGSPRRRDSSREKYRRDNDRSHVTRSPARISKNDFNRESNRKNEPDRRRGSHERRERVKSNERDIRERLSSRRDDKKNDSDRQLNNKVERKTIDSRQIVNYLSTGNRQKEDIRGRERESSSRSRSNISPIRFDKKVHSAERDTSVPREKKKRAAESPSKGITQSIESPKVSKRTTRKSKSPEPSTDVELSDSEPKPVSYYNMISTTDTPKVDETVEELIHVSDSSEEDDADTLRKKLLETELKKAKKRAKHKEKKAKKQKKKSKNKSDNDSYSNDDVSDKKFESVDESLVMKVTISNSDPSVADVRIVSQSGSGKDSETAPSKKSAAEESNEEGEIVSDSDDQKASIDTSDLRHKLVRQIGPMLPNKVSSKSAMIDLREKLSSRSSGDAVDCVAGPALPPHMRNRIKMYDDDVIEGPALPPHMKKTHGGVTKTLGPTLPSDMRERLALQADYSESDDDVVGPLPVNSDKGLTETQVKLEERALKLKMASLEGPRVKQPEAREEWMLELPDAKAKYLGFGPRQFRTKEAPDLSDRSSWTDTPKQKALKAAGVIVEDEEKMKDDIKKEAEVQYIQQRDVEQEEAIKKHRKKHKRDKTLVEIHQKKLEKKKKKDKDEDMPTRRPFSREVDLKVNRFDEAQKNLIMKKAQLLDTRFSSGQAKFL